MTTYTVHVGNMGQVLETTSRQEAMKTYGEYKRQSKAFYGRAAGEDVELFMDNEPLLAHYGAGNGEERT